MRVALSTRITEAPNYIELRDSISHDWITTLQQWNMVPLIIPNRILDVISYLEDLRPDLLVLTGGDNLDSTPERDHTEQTMLTYALDCQLPTLGVCRGLQLIAAHFGIELCSVKNHVGTTHTVSICEPFRTFYGNSSSVNSFHDIGISSSQVKRPLRVSAKDKDGFAESLIHESLPLAGVMWHPERTNAPQGDPLLFKHLIKHGVFSQ